MIRKLFAFLFFLFFTISAAAVPIAIYWLPKPEILAAEMDSKEKIMNRQNTGVILMDRNGQEFYRFYQGHHINPVSIDQIPDVAKQAVISAEDKNFYRHKGYSITAIAGALIADIREKKTIYGGSTITQQLVKNSFLTPDQSWQRKYQEIVLARQLEERYSKDEILEMYLNSVYFGEGAFGIGEAAQTYFSEPADKLTLPQAAMLAGLLNAPSRLSPISGDKTAATARQAVVLTQMKENGYITDSQVTQAEKADLGLKPSQEEAAPQRAPHFAQMVKQELIDKYGEDTLARSGFVVTTTLDLGWQSKAEDAVRKQVANLAKNQVTNGAAVVIEPKTGEIRALVGSKDWNDPGYGMFNVATSPRQPGSSFKPIMYLSGMEKGTITPATILHDKPTTFGKNYKPENYDKKFRGDVTVRRALANSINVPAVEAEQKVGVPVTMDLAKRLGITTLDHFSANDLSLALGSGEVPLLQMTGAYATLANNGQYIAPATYTKILDKQGDPFYQRAVQAKPAIDQKYVFLIDSILSDNNARKEIFGNSLTLPDRPAAVKTGTSQDYKDSWTIGYTPSLAIGVWVGNNDGRPMDKVAGSLGAAPIWSSLMQSYLAGTPAEQFQPTPDDIQVSICKSRGLKIPDKATSPDAISEWFVKGTEPTQLCFTPTPPPTPTPEATATPTPQPTPAATPAIGGNNQPIEPLPTPEPLPVETPDIPTPPPLPTDIPHRTPRPLPHLMPSQDQQP